MFLKFTSSHSDSHSTRSAYSAFFGAAGAAELPAPAAALPFLPDAGRCDRRMALARRRAAWRRSRRYRFSLTMFFSFFNERRGRCFSVTLTVALDGLVCKGQERETWLLEYVKLFTMHNVERFDDVSVLGSGRSQFIGLSVSHFPQENHKT